MPELTPAEVAEARRLCGAATPGPWRTPKDYAPESGAMESAPYVEGPDGYPVAAEMVTRDEFAANRDFIAAARTLLPRLLDDRERMEAEVADLRARVEKAEAEVERFRAALVDASKGTVLLDVITPEPLSQILAERARLRAALDRARGSQEKIS